MKRILVRTFALLFALSGCVMHAEDPQSFHIGVIDFFGDDGADLSSARQKLSIHSGDVIPLAKMESAEEAIRAEVFAATGMKVTDTELLCCDVPDVWDIYVGVEGSSYRPLEHKKAQERTVTLPSEIMTLYFKDLEELSEAVRLGQGKEDDSKGYALTEYPPSRNVQVAMRAYALGHVVEIEHVLRDAKDAQQRQAAAMLLGYSDRSEEQVAGLAAAVDDSDSEVRNNATRALEVMLASGPVKGFDATPFIRLLYSGKWSDRNKASILLYRMSATRDAALLLKLREAMGPLTDGARWHSAGHAYPFLEILGRIGGVDEKRLQQLIESGDKEQIIKAALQR